MKTKQSFYESPTIRVVEVMVENGFAASKDASGNNESLHFGGDLNFITQ